MGSPSRAQAVRAFNSATASTHCNNSASENRFREELIGRTINSPSATLSDTSVPTPTSISFSSAGGMVITAAPPWRRIFDVTVTANIGMKQALSCDRVHVAG